MGTEAEGRMRKGDRHWLDLAGIWSQKKGIHNIGAKVWWEGLECQGQEFTLYSGRMGSPLSFQSRGRM